MKEEEKSKKKYILIVDFPPSSALEKINAFALKYSKKIKVPVEVVVFHSYESIPQSFLSRLAFIDCEIYTDFSNAEDIINTVKPYYKNILCVVSRGDSSIKNLARFVPHVPYARVPTSESLIWSTNKLLMRGRFKSYNSKITPRFQILKKYTDSDIEKIEKKLVYPLIIKPLGLAQSLFVTIVYHRQELIVSLKKIQKGLIKIGNDHTRPEDRYVLIEEFMEGDQYSIDAYVNSRGKIYCCPPVHIKTGKQAGFDDFFGYRQMTPVRLKKTSVEEAENATRDAIHAVGLRSCTAHVELMRTEEGWKVIELGPRIGGFRDDLYELSYGFSHTENDLLIRMGKKPRINKTIKGYSAALKLYSKEEGIITSIKGLKTMEKLDSFVKKITQPKKIGEKVLFAKNGGKGVVNILLHNQNRSNLLADIRRIENTFKVSVKKK